MEDINKDTEYDDEVNFDELMDQTSEDLEKEIDKLMNLLKYCNSCNQILVELGKILKLTDKNKFSSDETIGVPAWLFSKILDVLSQGVDLEI